MQRITARSAVLVPLGALALLAAAAVGGCNTTRGVGEDVAATGNAVEKGANETQAKMFGPDHSSNQPQSAQAPEQNEDQRPAYQPSPAYSAPGY